MWTTVGKVALAWIPFYVLWTLFILSYGDATVGGALAGSAITITNAAVLGGAVWYFTGRFPWPDPVRLQFYGLHVVLAAAYSVAWFMAGAGISWARGLEPVNMRFWEWENIGWRFLMGVWLYGLVAGVSYALRIRRRLREQERAAARLETLATRARLDSLRARLNPHFLFNALNSLGALIASRPDRAQEMVEGLGGLLRYSLSQDEDRVSLDREWAFTKDYLDIERLRLGRRLRVREDIGPDARARAILPFSIHTLVENAVRHGLAPSEEGGTVSVRAQVLGPQLIVQVTDDGVGCDPAAVDASPGTGLRMLRERLAGEYGDGASLEVSTEPGEGFRATLTLEQSAEATPGGG